MDCQTVRISSSSTWRDSWFSSIHAVLPNSTSSLASDSGVGSEWNLPGASDMTKFLVGMSSMAAVRLPRSSAVARTSAPGT